MLYFKLWCYILAGWLCMTVAAGVKAGDLEDIQGTWKVVTLERGGKRTNGDEVKKAGLLMTFLGAEVGVGTANDALQTPTEHFFGPNPKGKACFGSIQPRARRPSIWSIDSCPKESGRARRNRGSTFSRETS